MFRKPKIFAFFLIWILGMQLVSIVQASPLYMVTASGKVSPDQPFFKSYDTRGIFGTPGASLVGASFVLKEFYDPNYGTRTTTNLTDTLEGAALVAVQVEVNGIGFSIRRGSVLQSNGSLELQTFNLSPLVTGLQSYGEGETANEIRFYSAISLVPSASSPGAGFDPPPVSLDNGFKYAATYPDAASVVFRLASTSDPIHPYLQFGAITDPSISKVESLTISEARVPEPSMISLFIAGLVGVGAFRRRARAR